MQKRAPTLANLLVIVLFALSCFGLLLFLWESFGGSVPLKPQGYRFSIDFPRTLLLAEDSDARISGVPVGHVVSLVKSTTGRNHVTIEIDHQYAPLRRNARVILRQKTLLGETYVEIIPGPRAGPLLPEGGELAPSHVEPIVTFDDILAALDPKTRRDFQLWQQTLATSFEGRGEDLNATFATLNPLIGHVNQVASILAEQQGAVAGLVKNTGVVFDALSERDHQLRGFITNGERTFSALAQSSQAFARAFRELPAFERTGTAALRSLDAFAVNTEPLLDQLRPAEIALTPLVHSIKQVSPDLNSLLTNIGPLSKYALASTGDVKKQLDLTVPILEAAIPFTRNFNPFLEELSRYVPELQAFFANFTAATQGFSQEGGPGGPRLHYLRALNTINPDTLALYAQRQGSNRASPYRASGASNAIATGGMPVFNSSTCANAVPTISGPGNAQVPQSLIELLVSLGYIHAKGSPGAVPAPACPQQPPFTINGRTTQYPQVTAASK
jgi:phospholipid/cholesterol/gamma-HCH transport system substrate-binding protein